MEMDRGYAWNFTNVTEQGRRSDFNKTIEWRQPPGVTSRDECLAWMELAVSFVQACRVLELDHYTLCQIYPSTVEGLRRFIEEGFVPHASDPRYLTPIFHGRSGREPPVRGTSFADGTRPEDYFPDQGRIRPKVLNDLRRTLGLTPMPIFFDGTYSEKKPEAEEQEAKAEADGGPASKVTAEGAQAAKVEAEEATNPEEESQTKRGSPSDAGKKQPQG
jgi:hypothetical protein